MHVPKSRRTAAPLVALLLLATPAVAQEKQRIPNVQRALAVSAVLAGGSGPASVNWIAGGERFAYTARNPATQREQIFQYDPASLADQFLFDPHELTLPGTAGEPLDYESFAWAATGRHVVFQRDFRPIYRHSGIADFLVYDLEADTLLIAADDARTAELSPDGTLLGFERGGDLFVYDLVAERERRLTTGGSDTIFNGVFDWVYEEEFSQTQAWRWAPDSRRIAFWQTDERPVPIVQLTDYEGQHPDWV
ncbi:MAG TPA: DPP IV N-terminal domain-containing protein, partial [Longimicrobiales bacterium]|nr:DPP IV N-terminal domain-containing protein [Longimicrobiales bacterium]